MKLRPCILLFLALTACHTSPSTRYYTVSSYDVTPKNVTSRKYLTLGKVTIPDMLDRSQIVLKTKSNEIRILEYDRWAEPFDNMVYRALADDILAQTQNGARATRSPSGSQRVTVAIDEFNADEMGQVILKATWALQSGQANTLSGNHVHIFQKTEAATGPDIDPIVATMSHLLGNLAVVIASQ